MASRGGGTGWCGPIGGCVLAAVLFLLAAAVTDQAMADGGRDSHAYTGIAAFFTLVYGAPVAAVVLLLTVVALLLGDGPGRRRVTLAAATVTAGCGAALAAGLVMALRHGYTGGTFFALACVPAVAALGWPLVTAVRRTQSLRRRT